MPSATPRRRAQREGACVLDIGSHNLYEPHGSPSISRHERVGFFIGDRAPEFLVHAAGGVANRALTVAFGAPDVPVVPNPDVAFSLA